MFEWIKNFFSNKKELDYKINFQKNKNSFYHFKKLLQSNPKITDDILKSLEIAFIQSDISLETVIFFMTEIKKKIKVNNITDTHKLSQIVLDTILSLYPKDNNLFSPSTTVATESIRLSRLEVYLFVGVNGVGKTTTIGKLAKQFKQQNYKVLLIAGDTFRSGAVEQLKIWSQRTDVDIFFKEQAKKPSNVIFEGLQLAKKQNYDVVLCDTAGRLENKINLMEELLKIRKVIKNILSYEPKETFLVLDAMMGQHSLKQVTVFQQKYPLTGVIVTKLDGTSKGGLILSLKHLYQLNVKYIGIGEQINDLIPFEINSFVNVFVKDLFETTKE